MDGYQLHFTDDTQIYFNPYKSGIVETREYKALKDFFQIKQGMLIWAHRNIHGEGMVINHPNFKTTPIGHTIFNEFFDESCGLLPFWMIQAMGRKETDKYYKQRREEKHYA
jgi:hypothetical protein